MNGAEATVDQTPYLVCYTNCCGEVWVTRIFGEEGAVAWVKYFPKDIVMLEERTLENPRDYRTLLMKYIAHVGESEGVNFLRDSDRVIAEGYNLFDDDDWAELQRLKQELDTVLSPPPPINETE